MMKWSTTTTTTTSKRSKKEEPPQQVQGAIDWEVRPGGLLVQKRIVGSDPGCGTTQIIGIKVSHESYHHHLSVPSVSTFGDLKKILARMINLEAKDQRLLFRGKEKGDDERLDMAGVKDMSKVILLEDPASKERKLIGKKNANVQAFDAVMKVRTEVDKLSHKILGS
ncbi:putative Ubiquitin-like domain-containing protein [Helianthus anomalus]